MRKHARTTLTWLALALGGATGGLSCGGARPAGPAAEVERNYFAMATLTLVNEGSGERTPLVAVANERPELQSGRLVYFLYAYRQGRPLQGMPTATLVLAFAEEPAVRTYYASADQTNLRVGFCEGGDFRELDPATGWSSTGRGHATVRISERSGQVLSGSLDGRLDTNDGNGFFLIDQGRVYIRHIDVAIPRQREEAPPAPAASAAAPAGGGMSCGRLIELSRLCYQASGRNTCASAGQAAREGALRNPAVAPSANALADLCVAACEAGERRIPWDEVATRLERDCAAVPGAGGSGAGSGAGSGGGTRTW